jgi:polysaccharide export outer membrane protein
MLLRLGNYAIVVLFLIIGLSSCRGYYEAKRNLLILQQSDSSAPIKGQASKLLEPIIQSGDILSVVFFSDNPEATTIYNQQQRVASLLNQGMNTSSAGVTSGNVMLQEGYLVDPEGFINLQTLGRVQVAGLTKKEVQALLIQKINPFLKNPHVDIRFLNYRVTILGEVNRPGVYPVQGEKINLLQLIGLAGDFTIYGRRDNILIIRENGKERESVRIDLRKTDIFNSPYYYLAQNDIVVIEPNLKKPGVDEQATQRNLTIATAIASMVSVVAIVLNVFK